MSWKPNVRLLPKLFADSLCWVIQNVLLYMIDFYFVVPKRGHIKESKLILVKLFYYYYRHKFITAHSPSLKLKNYWWLWKSFHSINIKYLSRKIVGFSPLHEQVSSVNVLSLQEFTRKSVSKQSSIYTSKLFFLVLIFSAFVVCPLVFFFISALPYTTI